MSDEQDVTAAGPVGQERRGEAGATAVVPGQRTEAQPAGPVDPPTQQLPAAAAPGDGLPQPGPGGEPVVPPTDEPAGTHHPTTPVTVRPRPRMPRPDHMIRMGPWAPVAGAAVGLLLGMVVVLFLAPAVNTFDQRLALVFVVLGLSLLGAGGTLLADEVRLLRRGTQAVEARSSTAGAIAGLLNGLTPARLLITASAFCLLLSAYVTSNH
jgi:hypothetical protein